MSKDFCHHHINHARKDDPKYIKVLWAALVINFTMFIVEILASKVADSLSILADSVDFLSDSGSYAIGLFLVAATIGTRAKFSILQAGIMALMGAFILGKAVSNFTGGHMPSYEIMSLIGILALVANLSVAAMLYFFREGDSFMRSIWLCSRNDAIGNLLIIFAAIVVYYTRSGIPDLVVASIMSVIEIRSAWQIIQQAKKEMS